MDVDTLTVPSEGREIFDPVHAWPDAPSRIYISAHRYSPAGVFQVGYDIVTGRTWLRVLPSPGTPWGAWTFPGGTSKLPPALLNAVMVNVGKSALLHFDLMLDPGSIPATSAFTVTHNGDPREVIGVRVSGTDVIVDIAGQAGSGTVLCSYMPPASNKLQSVDGIAVDAFTDVPVTTP